MINLNTTISINKETRDVLKNYGKKSETYNDIIMRMFNDLMIKEEVKKYLDEKEFVSVEDAVEWTKLKIKNDN